MKVLMLFILFSYMCSGCFYQSKKDNVIQNQLKENTCYIDYNNFYIRKIIKVYRNKVKYMIKNKTYITRKEQFKQFKKINCN